MPTHYRLDAGADTVHWGFFDARLPAQLTLDSGDTSSSPPSRVAAR